MPYPYGMQSAPAVGNGLGGLPRRQSDPKEPLIYEVLSKYRGTATVTTFEVPSGYSKMRITVIGRGAENGISPIYGGGKAISPVMQARSGQKVEINLGTSVATVTFGALVMTATNGASQNPGTATGGEVNLSGTTVGAGGITDPNSTEMGSRPGAESNTQAPPGGSSPGAPGGPQSTSGGGNVNNPGGQAMVRIVIW